MTPAVGVARNLAWLALGDGLSRGAIFVYAMLCARALGPEEFGIFSLAQGTALYAWIAVDLGVNLYGVREVARAGDGWARVVRDLLGLRMMAGMVLSTVYVISVLLFAPEAARAALALSAAYLLATAVSLDWAAKGLERFHLVALGNGVSAALVLAGYVALVRTTPDPATAVGVWGMAYFGGAALLHWGLRRGEAGGLWPRVDLASWRRHLSSSLLFATSGALLSGVQFVPVLVLTFYGGFLDVGIFSAPARVITVLMSAGFLLPMAVYPTLSRQAVQSGGGLRHSARRLKVIMAGAGTAVGVALYLGAGPLVELLFGQEYLGSVSLLRVMAWIVPVVFVRYSAGTAILAAGRQAGHSLASLGGLVVASIGCAVAIPLWGPLGAGVAWLLAEVVVALAMMWVWARPEAHG